MDTELRQRSRAPGSKTSGTKIEEKERRTTLVSRWKEVTAVTVTVVFLIIAVICPLVFRSSVTVRKSLLFMNWLNLPMFRNLSNPETEFGLNCTRNLYITGEKNDVRIGAWHILPKSRIADCDMTTYERLPEAKAFADDRQVILYLHGNGGARGGNHRKGLYNVLAYSDKLDYHVLAIDYRGYGDSTPLSPTTAGLVQDASTAYDWLLSQVGGRRDRITVWGHSLGTAIATYLVAQTEPSSQPASVVLEAPFNSIADAVRNHPFAQLFSWHPLFDYFFVQPLASDSDTNFDSESKIRHIHSHLLVLHAEDDMIIPFSMGQKLFQTAIQTRPASAPRAHFVSFPASKKYGHKAIFRDEELPDIISQFVQSSRPSKPN